MGMEVENQPKRFGRIAFARHALMGSHLLRVGRPWEDIALYRTGIATFMKWSSLQNTCVLPPFVHQYATTRTILGGNQHVADEFLLDAVHMK